MVPSFSGKDVATAHLHRGRRHHADRASPVAGTPRRRVGGHRGRPRRV